MRMTQGDIMEIHEIADEVFEYEKRLSAANCTEAATAASIIGSALRMFAGSEARDSRRGFSIGNNFWKDATTLVKLK